MFEKNVIKKGDRNNQSTKSYSELFRIYLYLLLWGIEFVMWMFSVLVSCVPGILGWPLSGWDCGSNPVWVPLLSRPSAEETLLWCLHQDGFRCYQTVAGLSHGPGASLYCQWRGESRETGKSAGERGVRGGFVLRMTVDETQDCWPNWINIDLPL